MEPPPEAFHGVDYVYREYGPGCEPLRWSDGRPVSVRLVDHAVDDAEPTLDAVCRQLADFTSIRLDRGAPLPAGVEPADVPDGMVAVAFVDLPRIAALRGRHPGLLRGRVFGHCTTRVDHEGGMYRSAFVAVRVDGRTVAGAVRDLRHQLGHAFGLGHSRRGTQLMSPCPAIGIDDFTVADELALRRLYQQSRPAGPSRSVIC